jgi:hypothetical protein
MESSGKSTYHTRLAVGTSPSPRTSGVQLNVNIGAHNLRILKKAGGDTPRSAVATPTSTHASPSTGHNAKQRKYERKSKRFIWPDELHRLFVAAIFDGAWTASIRLVFALLTMMHVSFQLVLRMPRPKRFSL